MAGRAHHRHYEAPEEPKVDRTAADRAYAEALRVREERRAEVLAQAVENRPRYFWERD